MQQETVKQQKKDLVQKQSSSSSSLAVTDELDLFSEEAVDTTDIIIPRLLIMHGMSEKVQLGEKMQGELVKSSDWTTVAKKGEKVNILLFDRWKTWNIFDVSGKKPKKVGMHDWDAKNDSLSWEFEENSIKMRRDKTYNFYGILTKEAEQDTSVWPVIISFSRSSFKTGHLIASNYASDLQKFKESQGKSPSPLDRTYDISVALETGKDESYFLFRVENGVKPQAKFKDLALKWKGVINQAKKSNTLVVHDEEIETAAKREF